MKLSVLAVGRIRESFFRDAVSEYTKRIGRYAKIEIREIPDEPVPERLSAAQIRQCKEKEGRRILEKQNASAYRIALCIDGTRMDSKAFSARLEEIMSRGISRIEFIIGGSNGLSDEVIESADLKLSFSDMTFPHQLMRVILLEQIYRAFKIMNHEPYHK